MTELGIVLAIIGGFLVTLNHVASIAGTLMIAMSVACVGYENIKGRKP